MVYPVARGAPGRLLSGSAIGAGNPQHVTGTIVVDPASENKEMVGEAVQVFERFGIDRLGQRQSADQPLGATCDGAREMKIGRCSAAARQDEGVEWPQAGVHRVDFVFEPLDLRG